MTTTRDATKRVKHRRANSPLPKYTKDWPAEVYRPETLPDNYDTRVDSAHIFALPETDGTSSRVLYITAHACVQCNRAKRFCSRGRPCSKCEELGNASSCTTTEGGWMPLKINKGKNVTMGPELASPKSTPRNTRNQRTLGPRFPASSSAISSLNKSRRSPVYYGSTTRKSARILKAFPESVSARFLRAAERAKRFRQSSRRATASASARTKREEKSPSDAEQDDEVSSLSDMELTTLSSPSVSAAAETDPSSPGTAAFSLRKHSVELRIGRILSLATAFGTEQRISPTHRQYTERDGSEINGGSQNSDEPSTGPPVASTSTISAPATTCEPTINATVAEPRQELLSERDFPTLSMVTNAPNIPGAFTAGTERSALSRASQVRSGPSSHEDEDARSATEDAVEPTSQSAPVRVSHPSSLIAGPSTCIAAPAVSREPSFRLSTSASWARPDTDSEPDSDSEASFIPSSNPPDRSIHILPIGAKRKRPIYEHIHNNDTHEKTAIQARESNSYASTSGIHLSREYSLPEQALRPLAAEQVQTDWDAGSSEEEVMRFLKRPKHSNSTTPSTAPPFARNIPVTLASVSSKSSLGESIVVQVEETLYQLPRNRLEKHSRYFAELIAKRAATRSLVLAPAEPGSQSDRWPVFQLTHVSSKDFQALLNVFDDIGTFIEDSPSYPDLLAIFCAARALRFGQLDAIAAYKLCTIWPPELPCVTPARVPYAAETVVIARTHNVPALLKRAFYELLRTEGFAQMDLNLPNRQEKSADGSDVIGRAELGRADLMRLVTAREKLGKAWAALVGSAPSDAVLPCPLQAPDQQSRAIDPIRHRCAEAWKNNASIWNRKVMEPGFFERWMLDPICGLDRLAAMDWSEAGFCSNCVRARRGLWQREKEDIWTNLDTWLGL
ncbi:hypothetical protein BC835DRAFT_1325040 [Cytidiella melzeri]|nr:hypothetical protein BC835DRAFT_1325040 [Cytidiella melzeri]